MSEYTKKLHIRKNGTVEDINLYTDASDLADSDNMISLKDGITKVYAQLGAITDENASSLRIRKNDIIYAVLKKIMIKDGWTRVYEDGNKFYSDAGYKNEITDLSGNIMVVGMKNNDLSNVDDILSRNKNIKKFKNTLVTSVGKGFLAWCSSLRSVYLPNLTSVGDDFMRSCHGITSIDLPCITSAGNNFLCDCHYIDTIYLRSSTVLKLNGSMGPIALIPSIYVPEALIDSYKTTIGYERYLKSLESIMVSKISIFPSDINATDDSINIYGDNRTTKYKILYNDVKVTMGSPDVDPQQIGVIWAVSGNATIAQDGVITLNNANVGDTITITAVSKYNNSITASKTVTVINKELSVLTLTSTSKTSDSQPYFNVTSQTPESPSIINFFIDYSPGDNLPFTFSLNFAKDQNVNDLISSIRKNNNTFTGDDSSGYFAITIRTSSGFSEGMYVICTPIGLCGFCSTDLVEDVNNYFDKNKTISLQIAGLG